MSYTQKLNQILAKNRQSCFEPQGICAFSNCCGTCTCNYADPVLGFIPRVDGINFFTLKLDGMNYDERPEGVFVGYGDYDYLMANWDEEKEVIEEFAEVLDVKCTYEKPKRAEAICVKFEKPLELEAYEDGEDSESEEAPDNITIISYQPVQTSPQSRKSPTRRAERSKPYTK